MGLVGERLAHAMITTNPVPGTYENDPVGHALTQVKRFLITNVEKYIPDRNSYEWNEFKDSVLGKCFVILLMYKIY